MSRKKIRTIEEKFEWVISFMTQYDRFGFQILNIMEKIPTKGLGTLGVTHNGVRVQLLYDPDFVEKLPEKQLAFILTHEVFHVVFHHITLRRPHNPKEMEMQNVAADLAINCLIPTSVDRSFPLDDNGERMGCFPESDHFPYPAKYSLSNYLALLRDAAKDNSEDEDEGEEGGPGEGGIEGEDGEGSKGGTGGGNGEEEQGGKGKGQGKGQGKPSSFDNHDGWEESELVDEQIRNTIDKVEKSGSWGSMPGELKELIKAAQVREVSWERLLRFYFGNVVTRNTEYTIKKPNRRFGYPYLGSKKVAVDRVLVGIDTSMSVGSDELAKFICEVNGLAERQPVDMMLFDTRLVWPKPKSFDRKVTEFIAEGRGGTNFEPIVKLAKDKRYKTLVILSDGYASPPVKPIGVDVIWVITPEGECPVSWGKQVVMKSLK